MVINKRIKRVFLENKAQYIGDVLLIVLSCFLFTNLILVSNNLTRLMNEYEKDYVQEDASFTTDKSIGNLPGLESASDAIIEEGKSFDYALSEGSTLRVFTKNDKINIPAIIEGNELKGSGEILLNPAFAATQNYKIGDVLTILGKPFTVAGFMALPNYIYPLKLETDLLYSPQNFGIAVISKEDFAALSRTPKSGDRKNVLYYQHRRCAMSGYNKSFRVQVAKEATQLEMKGMEEHIARKYGIRPSTVVRWAAIYREFGESGLGKKISSPTKKSDREIQLEKENAELKEEVAILKKAAAFLAEVGRR